MAITNLKESLKRCPLVVYVGGNGREKTQRSTAPGNLLLLSCTGSHNNMASKGKSWNDEKLQLIISIILKLRSI